MSKLQFSNIRVAALTCAVPANIQKVNLDPESPNHSYLKSFVRQIGITQRHISITEQTCSDTGYVAALEALKKASLKSEDIDAVIFFTQTPDFNPGTSNAHIIQHRLSMRKDVMAFDVPLGCSSFPYGLSICGSLLQQKSINRILMLTGDTHWCDYKNSEDLLSAEHFINAEGTTALILEKKDGYPVNISLYSDGSGYKYLFCPKKGDRNAWRPFTKAKLANGTIIGTGEYMDGIEITSFATTTVVECIRNFLSENNKKIDDFDGIVLHQANKQIVKTIAKRLNADLEKVPMSMDRYANTDGATVSLTIADAYSNDSRDKLKLLVSAFGVGLSWGVASLEIEPSVIVPIIEVEDARFEEGYVTPIE